MRRSMLFFIFNGTATTEIYTLSLHDALPIFGARAAAEHFGGGQLHYGADATFSTPITAWLRFALSIGARQGRSVDSERGEILSSALGAETRVELVYYTRPSFEALFAVGVRGCRVRVA